MAIGSDLQLNLSTLILPEGGVLFSFRDPRGRKLKRKLPEGKFWYTRWVPEGLWRGSDESLSNVKVLRHGSQKMFAEWDYVSGLKLRVLVLSDGIKEKGRERPYGQR